MEAQQAMQPETATKGYVAGKNAPKKALVDAPPATPELTEIEVARLEGLVRDAVSDMTDACVEGRAIGIQQIWDEIKSNEYVAQRVWGEMQKTENLFRTMKDVLKPNNKAARGPKPQTQGE